MLVYCNIVIFDQIGDGDDDEDDGSGGGGFVNGFVSKVHIISLMMQTTSNII